MCSTYLHLLNKSLSAKLNRSVKYGTLKNDIYHFCPVVERISTRKERKTSHIIQWTSSFKSPTVETDTEVKMDSVREATLSLSKVTPTSFNHPVSGFKCLQLISHWDSYCRSGHFPSPLVLLVLFLTFLVILVVGGQLEQMILEVFSNLYDSMILWFFCSEFTTRESSLQGMWITHMEGLLRRTGIITICVHLG